MRAAYPAKNLLLRLRVQVDDFRADARGQDLIEYALMAAFLAVAVVGVMPALGTNIVRLFSEVASVLLLAKATGS
jgi:Flp pilus assembly pilin Flp